MAQEEFYNATVGLEHELHTSFPAWLAAGAVATVEAYVVVVAATAL